MSPQQMIDLAYVIFAKQPILQQDLRLWNRKILADRTWPNMIQHLRDAQTDLSSLPSAEDIYHHQPPHQASIATMAELVAQQLLEEYNNSTSPVGHPALPPLPTPPDEVANSLQCRETDLQTREASMLTQMQDMMLTMMRNNNNANNHGNNNNHTNNHGYHNNNNNQNRGGRGRGRNNDRSNSRTQTRGYC